MLETADLARIRRWTTRVFFALATTGLALAAVAPLLASSALGAVGKGLLLLYGLPVMILLPVRAARQLLLQVNRSVPLTGDKPRS
jgi:hypothetical protein